MYADSLNIFFWFKLLKFPYKFRAHTWGNCFPGTCSGILQGCCLCRCSQVLWSVGQDNPRGEDGLFRDGLCFSEWGLRPVFSLCNALVKLHLCLDTQQKCELFSQNCHVRTQNKDTQVLIRLEIMNQSPACCELQKCQVTPVDKQWPQSSHNKAFSWLFAFFPQL